MKTLLMAPAAYNLAETTRMLEIARTSRDFFDVHFLSFGGQFEQLIHDAGFPVHELEPRLTPAKIEHIYKLDKGEKLGVMFTVDEINQRISQEMALLNTLKPATVITGFSLTIPLSTRIQGTPLVWVVQSTWLKETGMGMVPANAFGIFRPLIINLISFFADFASRVIMLGPVNRVARQHNVQTYRGFADFITGQENLLAEPPMFSDLNIPTPHHHLIGPLIAREDYPIPPEVNNIPHDLPIIYFAMGSSGTPEIVAEILQGFEGKPYRVIAPIRNLIKQLQVNIPSNVIVTDYLPAHEVNPMADLSLIHGGIGTVMTAAQAGKPVVGIGMQPEQDANIKCLVRKGFAIRIPKRKADRKTVMAAVEKMINNEQAKHKAEEYAKQIEPWDGPGRAAAFLHERFGDK